MLGLFAAGSWPPAAFERASARPGPAPAFGPAARTAGPTARSRSSRAATSRSRGRARPPRPSPASARFLHGDIVFGNLEGTLAADGSPKCSPYGVDGCFTFRAEPSSAKELRAGFTS